MDTFAKERIYDADQSAYKSFQAAYLAAQKHMNVVSVSLNEEDTAAMMTAMVDLRKRVTELAKRVDYSEALDWTIHHYCWKDPDINEIDVDFR